MQPNGGMTNPQAEVVSDGRFMQVGREVFVVFGNDECGWCIDPGDLCPEVPVWCRYRTRDELFFALVNLHVGEDGRA
jgi:hypothetical protein